MNHHKGLAEMDHKILTVIGTIMLIFLGKITYESDLLTIKRQSDIYIEKTSLTTSSKIQNRS